MKHKELLTENDWNELQDMVYNETTYYEPNDKIYNMWLRVYDNLKTGDIKKQDVKILYSLIESLLINTDSEYKQICSYYKYLLTKLTDLWKSNRYGGNIWS